MEQQYIGDELELFDKAKNWKSYYGDIIKPFLKGTVMEVGAGIGATTVSLINDAVNRWICLEPDQRLAAKISEKLSKGLLPQCEIRVGTIRTQPVDEQYNAIIYIDVIEHIEHDTEELSRAALHLKSGGHLIILVPAHQSLYSPFDKAIGHFRRYSKKMLAQAVPPSLKSVKLIYLDSIGLAASAANKIFLRQSYPTLKQVLFWDNTIVPLSRRIDPLIAYAAGKSVLGIWQKI